MSLQTLIKNMQELAKEEGDESEAKLREAIKILGGGPHSPLQAAGETSKWRFLGVQILASR